MQGADFNDTTPNNIVNNFICEKQELLKNPENDKIIKNMIVIMGLGNLGEKFRNTRHNTGFMAVDFFAEKNSFPKFEFAKKYESLISEKDEIILVKPQIFMNESGQTVKKITTYHKLQIINLVVVHDDIDLPLGKIKFSKDSGSGGHKGVDSIIQNLGRKDFVRLRIGVCPQKGKPIDIEKFVIKSFTREENEIIKKSIEKSSDALIFLIKNGLEKTMNEYNG